MTLVFGCFYKTLGRCEFRTQSNILDEAFLQKLSTAESC